MHRFGRRKKYDLTEMYDYSWMLKCLVSLPRESANVASTVLLPYAAVTLYSPKKPKKL